MFIFKSKTMKYLGIWILVLICINSIGQTVTLQNDRQIIAYYKRENPITVGVEGYKCESIILKSQKYLLKKSEEGSCRYLYVPTGYVRDTIYFYTVTKTSDTTLVDFQPIRILPFPMVGIINMTTDNRHISVKDLEDFPRNFGVTAFNTNLSIRLPVDSFFLSIKRNCKITYSAFFTKNDDFSELKKEFKLLKKDDELLFDSIYYTLDNEIHIAPFMRVIIKD